MKRMDGWIIARKLACILGLAVCCLPMRLAQANTGGDSYHGYRTLQTLSYDNGRGVRGHLPCAAELLIRRCLETPERASYYYGFIEDALATGDRAVEITLPSVELQRNRMTERFVGGDSLLRNFGGVANMALGRVEGRIPADGRLYWRTFRFPSSPGCPAQIGYGLQARKERLPNGTPVLAFLAVSHPFTYALSGGGGSSVLGEQRTFAIMTEDMDDVLMYAGRFSAKVIDGADKGAEMVVEQVAVKVKGEKALSMTGLGGWFDDWWAAVGFTKDAERAPLSVAWPPWVLHSLSVRGFSEVVCGAAIEGRPNFTITATVGMVLLLDSGVSATTTLLKEMGVIDHDWEGIPATSGRGVGLGLAYGLEKLTDVRVDNEKWGEWGSVAGSVASLFIPSSWSGAGVKIGNGGVKVLRDVSLAGKNLRISSQGIQLVKGGTSWMEQASTYTKASNLKKILSATKTGVKAGVMLAEEPVASYVVDQTSDIVARLVTRAALERFLEDNPRHPEREKVREAWLAARGRPLAALIKEGYVEAEGHGINIQRATLRLRRRVPHHVTVIVPRGTYLASRSAPVQNMIVTAPSRAELRSDGWFEVPVSVACANRNKKEPSTESRFDVHSGPESLAIFKLVAELDEMDAPLEVMQRAVWCVTDDPGLADSGLFMHGVVKPEYANLLANILVICGESGIDVRKRKLWADRSRFMDAVTKGELRRRLNRLP